MMNIIVLIKYVPNTAKVEIDQKTGNLIREGVEGIMNPDDLHAIETSLVLRDINGGKITVMTMGPPQSIDALSEAIGMGVDDTILLSDKAFSGADTWATSHVLGKTIEHLEGYDLILCGSQAIDGDTAQVGPQVAAFLNIPQVTYVFEIVSAASRKVTVKHKTENGYSVVQCDFPALLSIAGGTNVPRYPIISGLISACQKKASIKIWNAADIGVKVWDVGTKGSFTQVVETFSPSFKRHNEILVGKPSTVVKTLFSKFEENNLI